MVNCFYNSLPLVEETDHPLAKTTFAPSPALASSSASSSGGAWGTGLVRVSLEDVHVPWCLALIAAQVEGLLMTSVS